MIYTIFGLPLMMMFLANIGSLMAKVTSYTYSRFCCRWCRVRRKRSELTEEEILEGKKISLRDDNVPDEDYMPTGSVRMFVNKLVLGVFYFEYLTGFGSDYNHALHDGSLCHFWSCYLLSMGRLVNITSHLNLKQLI